MNKQYQGKQNKDSITSTKDCYKILKSEAVVQNPDYLKVSMKSNISRVSFQIIKKADQDKEKSVQVAAMGNTIVKLIRITEFLKKQVHGLHMSYKIGEIEFEETFEPLYEGLKTVKAISKKPAMFVSVSFNEKLLKNEPGYFQSENTDKDNSKQLIEKAKSYSQSQNNEQRNKKMNNNKFNKNNGEENKEKVLKENKEQKEAKKTRV